MRRPRAPRPPLAASPTFLFGRFFRPWGSTADLDDALDLHRDGVGQRSHAHGGARVLALVAEHLDEQVRAAVDDLRLVAELGRAVHHAEQLHHAAHAVEAAELGLQRALLAHADAVLAGAGAFHGQRALHQARVEGFGLVHLGPAAGIDQDHEVEVAVADVAEERDRHRGSLDLLRGFGDALGQARDRHAYVGGYRTRAGLELQAGEVGVVARLPDLRAVFGAGGPLEVEPA